MSIYSCNYPVMHTFSSDSDAYQSGIEYKILLDNKIIYEGKIYPYTATGTVQIDISEVCRNYLDTFYEDIMFSEDLSKPENLLSKNSISTIATFSVSSDYNWDEEKEEVIDEAVDYLVMYNYNTDFRESYGDALNLNFPIHTEADSRQYITMSGYNIKSGEKNTFSYSVNGKNEKEPSLNSKSFQLFAFKPSAVGAEVGDTITVSNNGVSYHYKIVAPCHNRFVLYYVNKFGGLDSLLCSGKAVESFNASYTDARLYNDRSNSKGWEQKRLHTEIDKQYQLNTLLLDDEGASLIDHLIYSPKVWIHDLSNTNKDIIKSVLITNTSYTIKNFRNDKVVQYTINVKESNKQIRR